MFDTDLISVRNGRMYYTNENSWFLVDAREWKKRKTLRKHNCTKKQQYQGQIYQILNNPSPFFFNEQNIDINTQTQ